MRIREVGPDARKRLRRPAVIRTEGGQAPIGDVPLQRARGRARWNFDPENPKPTLDKIEAEARAIIVTGGQVTHKGLKAIERQDLLRVVTKYYPDGFSGLQQALDVAKVKKPRRYWQDLGNITAEANAFLEVHGSITPRLINVHGPASLYRAIIDHYPGGWTQFKQEAGFETKKKPGYWTQEVIEAEARKFIDDHGKLTQKNLGTNGRTDLQNAIATFYPGGLTKLKTDLGLETVKHGYWTPEVIRQEAAAFYEEHGTLALPALIKERSDLAAQARMKYPGGIKQLREDLEVEHPNKQHYWTPEKIELEAQAFINEHGNLSQLLLAKNEKGDLLAAIVKRYPGGILELKKKAGLEHRMKPAGYWTPEQIVLEAVAFLGDGNDLTSKGLKAQGRNDLLIAIHQRYPGGFTALRGELKIKDVQELSKEDANKDLDTLLEGNL